jgi:hypothetical protein
MHVPQNKIHSFLFGIGVQISTGEIDRILSADKDIFHTEKEEILATGIKISPFVVVDDTGHRHKGNNGFCTHIGNDLFAFFHSSERKNRINFLEILCGKETSYHITGFSMAYFKKQNLPELKLKLLGRARGQKFMNKAEWIEFLKRLGIKDKNHERIATEGALIGSIIKSRINPNFTIVSDDAGQFDVLSHALCWIHSERVITSLHTVSFEQDELVKEALNDFWELFQMLHAYKNKPSIEEQRNIENRFNEVFSRQTSYPSLNKACKSLKTKKCELLLALNKPEIPLSNNISERDIRDMATKRKISAGTRSDTGRQCRDTFMSLKKTSVKLNVSFREYVLDRLSGKNEIPRLPELMKQTAQAIYRPIPAF